MTYPMCCDERGLMLFPYVAIQWEARLRNTVYRVHPYEYYGPSKYEIWVFLDTTADIADPNNCVILTTRLENYPCFWLSLVDIMVDVDEIAKLPRNQYDINTHVSFYDIITTAPLY